MRLIDIYSNRAYMYDINRDGRKELIIPRLSNILIIDPSTGKIMKKIKIKPKVEKKVRAYDREIIMSVSSGDVSVERHSIAGEILLKFVLCDINNDSKDEIVLLRADGIMACYSRDGKEIWSTFEDPYINDFIVDDINNDSYYETISVSRGGTLYVTLHNGKTIKTFLGNIYSTPLFVRTINVNANKLIIIITQDGNLYMLKIRISKRPAMGWHIATEIVDIINLSKYGIPTSIYATPSVTATSGKLVLGFEQGKLVLVDIINKNIDELELKDRIACIGPLLSGDTSRIIASDWSGNIILINDKRVEKLPALPRKTKIDLDDDGEDEIISIFAKKIRIIKNNIKIFSVEGRSYITAYLIADVNNDDHKEIILCWNSRSISIYRLDGKLVDSIKTTSNPKGLIVMDINNDKKKEIICCGEQTIEVYSI